MSRTHRLLSLVFLLSLPPGLAFAQGPEARLEVAADGLYWSPTTEHGGAILRVSGPAGDLATSFEASETARLDLSELVSLAAEAGVSVDGTYTWELALAPALATELLEKRAIRRSEQGEERGMLGVGAVVAGTFRVVQGSLIAPSHGAGSLVEESGSNELVTKTDHDEPTRQYIGETLYVDGSLCVGDDCVNNEAMGFDTIRLKENNLRIKFDDTSDSASFPDNDWQITANDSANGGAERFSIEDISGGRTPFTIRAGARSNALYVDSQGDIGIGTSAPVTDIHVLTGDSPTLRLDQNNSSGFEPQIWDVAGNEASFFVRDATNGSTLPLRIRPGAPSSSIDIAAGGNVGMGTSSPSASLHVERSDGTAGVLVKETSAASEKRQLLTLENSAGGVQFALVDTANSRRWNFALLNNGSFSISLDGSGGPEIEVTASGRVKMGPGGTDNFDLLTNGNLTIAGTLAQGSSRAIKSVVGTVDPADVLARLARLPLATWSYLADEQQGVHLGPMAEDFFAAFGLGADDRHIAPADLASVAIAAVQGLQDELAERDAAIEQRDIALEQRVARIDELEGRLAELETLVASLASDR